VTAQLDEALSPAYADISVLRSWTNTRLFSLPPDAVRELQLHWLRRRFAELRPRIRVLDRLATECGIDEITDLDDGSVLCMPHTIFKAYTTADVEKHRFERLTRWLGSLTVHDLTEVDLTGVDSLHTWLLRLEEQTPLRPHVSSGTSGKVSVYPKSRLEGRHLMEGLLRILAPCGEEPGIDITSGRYPFLTVWPATTGHHHLTRMLELMREEIFPGHEDMVITRGNQRLTADDLWLAGKLRRAEALGEEIQLSEAEELRREQLAAQAAEFTRAQMLDSFIERAVIAQRGRTIGLMSPWIEVIQLAQACKDRGIEPPYNPDSVIMSGGGSKGFTFPDGWRELVDEMFPSMTVVECYGMSENSAQARKCRAGYYHTPPWGISWILDPKTSEPRPRSRVQTGRHACFDLLAETYWAGTISGDKVTAHWDETCACGRLGVFFDGEITRYGADEGGDDKITCSRTPDAYNKLVDFALAGPGI
jgi:hypothetical protein